MHILFVRIYVILLWPPSDSSTGNVQFGLKMHPAFFRKVSIWETKLSRSSRHSPQFALSERSSRHQGSMEPRSNKQKQMQRKVAWGVSNVPPSVMTRGGTLAGKHASRDIYFTPPWVESRSSMSDACSSSTVRIDSIITRVAGSSSPKYRINSR
jgi:hypothetical protein